MDYNHLIQITVQIVFSLEQNLESGMIYNYRNLRNKNLLIFSNASNGVFDFFTKTLLNNFIEK